MPPVLPSQFRRQIATAVRNAATAIGAPLPEGNFIERPRDESHGDYSSPLPLHLARHLRRKPDTIAADIAAALKFPTDIGTDITVSAAPPGFLNFTIADAAKTAVIPEILAANAAVPHTYGTHPAVPRTVLLEFVSANPTGPLHVGHGRAAAYGDALANILQATGVTVHREYYVNDAGRQMDILAASAWLRYWQDQSSPQAPLPEGAYRGAYLSAAAQQMAPTLGATHPPDPALPAAAAARDGDTAADLLVAAVRTAAGDSYLPLRDQLGAIMLRTVIQRNMQALAIDTAAINFYSESALHQNHKVQQTINALQQRGELYEKDGALWFRASAYGDEKDRVVRRANGELTYFAADIAYHADKLTRPHSAGHTYGILNILGADHHGYVPRIAAAMQALGYASTAMQTELIQFVSLFENGARVKMSTRAGEFITLEQLIEAVGVNATRYYYLNRKNDQHLDFDLTAAKAQDRQNPIYYISYAHARIYRLLNRWRADFSGDLSLIRQAAPALLAADPTAVRLCALLLQYPDLVSRAAAEHAPHLLAVYLHDLSAQLQIFYENARILPPKKPNPSHPDDPDTRNLPLRHARLALLLATQQVLSACATLLGITLPESM